MPTIDHADGSNTSIEQEPNGSWTVVTTDAFGDSGAAESFGSNYTEKDLTDKFTYSNDTVASSSVDHDDGSRAVIDQLGSGGWSVYTVDGEGNEGPSTEYGSNYTREELAASAGAVDAMTAQPDPPAAEPAPAEAPATDTSAQLAPGTEESLGESSTPEGGGGGAKGDDSGTEQEGAEGEGGKGEEGTGG